MANLTELAASGVDVSSSIKALHGKKHQCDTVAAQIEYLDGLDAARESFDLGRGWSKRVTAC